MNYKTTRYVRDFHVVVGETDVKKRHSPKKPPVMCCFYDFVVAFTDYHQFQIFDAVALGPKAATLCFYRRKNDVGSCLVIGRFILWKPILNPTTENIIDSSID